MPIYEADTVERIARAYERGAAAIAVARGRLQRPLTLAEKILFAHMSHPETQGLERGADYADLQPDRVALQDATAQMALLQFELAGLQRVQAPTTVHCDHLIQARVGATPDLRAALEENQEVYDFLESAAARYGAGFWKPGSGIIHQVIFENYAFPGGLMIGTDSHTPNAGGMGMLAIGVGGADAVDVMAGLDWGVTMPKLIGVRLRGALSGWASPKDVILRVADELTVKGGTGAIVEYFGEGVASMSATGRGTVTNMGAEIGATTSVFPFDAATARYLRATGREAVAELAEAHAADLRADPGVDPMRHEIFDQIIEIDLSTLEPAWVGPHTPDLRHTAAAVGPWAASQNYPLEIKDALIGSCTNSSYEDLSRAASLARQAAAAGLQVKVPLLVTPGSEQVRATVERDGQIAAFESVGGTVLANACGPCIGQWKREDIAKGETNTIVTSFNRNFPARNDANPQTLAFIGSPEMVVAAAFAGRLGFDPRTDSIPLNGGSFRFAPPVGDELPRRGYEQGDAGFVPAPDEGSSVEVVVSPDSQRLQRLTAWTPWDGRDVEEAPILLKSRGKTTTDHISPAGPWLRFRGHLDNISDNTFSGVNNAFTSQTGTGNNVLSGEREKPLPDVARSYKAAGHPWVAIGDENYGEGSSREHAAMQPRHLGGVAVIVRSFARIAETNLKKQGMLPLRFVDAADYDKFGEQDRVSIRGLGALAPGKPLAVEIHHPDGRRETIEVTHSFTEDQIGWFRAGGALNEIAAAQQAKTSKRRKPAAKGAKRVTARKIAAKARKAGKARAAATGAARAGAKKVAKKVAKAGGSRRGTGAKKAAKPTSVARSGAKKAVKRTGAKKAVKRTAAKKAVKRTAAKKAVKRAGAKKAVKRTGAKKAVKRTAAKKAIKRPGAKKAVKRTAAKKAVKRTGAKKAVKRTAAKKAIKRPGVKKAVKRTAAKKVAKKAVKRTVAKKTATKAAKKSTRRR